MIQFNFEKKSRAAFDFYDAQPQADDLRSAVLAGLQKKQKSIPPKFFYDWRGSQLFGQICSLPEYYPTRTEIGILKNFRSEIAEQVGESAVIVEYGCGNSEKIKILLDSLRRPRAYIALDIARAAILELAESLAEDYPRISIHAVCADFTALQEIPFLNPQENNHLAFFPGSSIGNFETEAAKNFLANISKNMGANSALLIGVDLKKDPQILHAAYNDSRGVTAAFNKNLLQRINHECAADFDLEQFRHHAFYNAELGRIEMHLISQRKQEVQIGNVKFHFNKDESIHTESSYKYSLEEFQGLARQAGWHSVRSWVDAEGFFSLHYLKN